MCPKPQVNAFARTVVDMYHWHKKGILAVAGGILDQPNVYLEAMNIVANVFSEYENAGMNSGY